MTFSKYLDYLVLSYFIFIYTYLYHEPIHTVQWQGGIDLKLNNNNII